MNTNANSYTFIYASVLVVVIAVLLAGASTLLRKPQQANLDQEKMQSIVRTIGIDATRPESEVEFGKYVKGQTAVNMEGEEVQADIFSLDLNLERKKPVQEQVFPLYIAEKDGGRYYIIPLYGDGLWDLIWGYIALESDFNTIYGVVFDHKSETSGLGAEIANEKFQQQFKGKKLFSGSGNYEFRVQKGGAATLTPDMKEYAVDALSGGTLTSDAVTNMIAERVKHYVPYFNSVLGSGFEEENSDTINTAGDSIITAQ